VGQRLLGQFSPFRDSLAPLLEDKNTRAANRAADEACKKKKDVEKMKKEAQEHPKLQCWKHR
jgi:hypothetical protein